MKISDFHKYISDLHENLGFLRKSWIFAKIPDFHKNLGFARKSRIFGKISDFRENPGFSQKSRIFMKIRNFMKTLDFVVENYSAHTLILHPYYWLTSGLTSWNRVGQGLFWHQLEKATWGQARWGQTFSKKLPKCPWSWSCWGCCWSCCCFCCMHLLRNYRGALRAPV